MEHLIKQINMIDILGMILPGGLLLILFEQDINFLSFMSHSVKADDPSVIVWSITFLLGSYFVGMLLHEWGSIVERILWKNPLTDPRVYAALNTEVEDALKIELLDNHNFVRKCWNAKLYIVEFCKKEWRKLCYTVPAICVVYLAAGNPGFLMFMAGMVILAIIACVLQASTFVKLYEIRKDETKWTALQHVLSKTDEIMRNSVASDEYERKRGLFNGFRSLARSMLIMLAVAQSYVMMCPAGSTSKVVQLQGDIYKAPELLFLQVLVVITLVIRYWHYSYLRYIYCYCGYIRNKNKPSQPEKKEFDVHIRISGEASNTDS